MKKALLLLLVLMSLSAQSVDAKSAAPSNTDSPSIIKRALGATAGAIVGPPMVTYSAACFVLPYAETPLSLTAVTAAFVPISLCGYPFLLADCVKRGWQKPFSADALLAF
jgi:hypothetical protein